MAREKAEPQEICLRRGTEFNFVALEQCSLCSAIGNPNCPLLLENYKVPVITTANVKFSFGIKNCGKVFSAAYSFDWIIIW